MNTTGACQWNGKSAKKSTESDENLVQLKLKGLEFVSYKVVHQLV